MPRALWWSRGVAVSYERGTPVAREVSDKLTLLVFLAVGGLTDAIWGVGQETRKESRNLEKYHKQKKIFLLNVNLNPFNTRQPPKCRNLEEEWEEVVVEREP